MGWIVLGVLLGVASAAAAGSDNPAGVEWVDLPRFSIARTETTVGQFRRFVLATRFRTRAEIEGGGEAYEVGWVKKRGWVWHAPLGVPAEDDEPAAHVTFQEAQIFCRWAGGRLPRDEEWVSAAYQEQRAAPPAPFERGRRYDYPVGDTPLGAQCLEDCGPQAAVRSRSRGVGLLRGVGPAPAGSTPAGVNGLHEMGGNLWEWVEGAASGNAGEKQTRGGSWWYGAAQMREGHRQFKPVQTAVVYIGFRCVRDR